MKFIDIAEIKLRSGSGGNGMVSFRREKFVPKGGPDGGTGGAGGSIYAVGDSAKHTLMDFRYKHIYKAEDGQNGKPKDMTGRCGEDLILPVPIGTIIKNADTESIIADITKNGERVLLASGGRGGRGNSSFASATHRAPTHAEEGQEGEELSVILELKLLADVGVIGFPNAGKSTFISSVSEAKPKIADYPFTTLTPNLGVVKDKTGGSFVLADMPGLIEDAHTGVGLGIQFLKHIERCKVLLHLIDASYQDDKDMIYRYEAIRKELKLYNKDLIKKKEIVVASKSDSLEPTLLEPFEKYLKKKKIKLFKISSVSGLGLDELIEELRQELCNI